MAQRISGVNRIAQRMMHAPADHQLIALPLQALPDGGSPQRSWAQRHPGVAAGLRSQQAAVQRCPHAAAAAALRTLPPPLLHIHMHAQPVQAAAFTPALPLPPQMAYAANVWVRNVRIINADNGIFLSWVHRSSIFGAPCPGDGACCYVGLQRTSWAVGPSSLAQPFEQVNPARHHRPTDRCLFSHISSAAVSRGTVPVPPLQQSCLSHPA